MENRRKQSAHFLFATLYISLRIFSRMFGEYGLQRDKYQSLEHLIINEGKAGRSLLPERCIINEGNARKTPFTRARYNKSRKCTNTTFNRAQYNK